MVDITTGTEFDSGDTRDGQTIWGKRISLGSLVNAGTKSVSHGITGLLKVQDINMIADSGTQERQPSFTPNGNNWALAVVKPTTVEFQTDQNYSAWTGTVIIYYTRA